jgi:hypothetical protein
MVALVWGQPYLARLFFMLVVVVVVLVREVPPQDWERLVEGMEQLEIAVLRQPAELLIRAVAEVLIQVAALNLPLAPAAPASLSFVTQQTLTPRHQ